MALRQGGRALARSLMQAKFLPTRGGGGGPIKYAAPPQKPLPLEHELWWHDGLYHSQPALDYTLGTAPEPLGTTVRNLFLALGSLAGIFYACDASWSNDNNLNVPHQYPPEVLETFASRGKAQQQAAALHQAAGVAQEQEIANEYATRALEEQKGLKQLQDRS